jgi:hydrogenase maturation factor
MCLAIPKKVIGLKENGQIILELFDGTRQAVKTIVGLAVGDYCLTQQNIAIEKITTADAEMIFQILKENGEKL